MTDSPDALPRLERWAVAGGVLGLSVAAWWYTVRMALAGCCAGAGLAGVHGVSWGAAELASTLGMWAVMMAGMMLPTALPATLALAAVARGQGGAGGASAAVPVFVGGYLAVWTAYSLLASLVQWGLHAAALLSPVTLSTGPAVGGALLAAAGVFQWTPFKDACMVKCRTPLGSLLAWWRPGPGGAFLMGLRYGTYCVGCCWLLMALSFALGVMNLLWMGAVTALMILEKAGPWGRPASRGAGLALAGWGAWLLLERFFA